MILRDSVKGGGGGGESAYRQSVWFENIMTPSNPWAVIHVGNKT